jgi:hypothetical protein
MKKLLFIILALGFTSAFSQSLKIETFEGGALFIKVSSTDTSFYSSNSQVFAYIDRSGKVSFTTKLGGQIGPSYLFSEISLNGVTYGRKDRFIGALDALDFFSPVAGGVSLWTTTGGHYAPTETKPFRFESGDLKLVNDTVIGPSTPMGVMKFPFAGALARDYVDYKGFNGIVEMRDPFSGLSSQFAYMGWVNFSEGKENGIMIMDTSAINIQNKNVQMSFYPSDIIMTTYNDATGDEGIFNMGNSASINVELIGGLGAQLIQEMSASNGLYIEYSPNVGGTITLKLNSNGLVLPNLPTAPTGENGAMYYNTSTNHGQIYRNGTWHNL